MNPKQTNQGWQHVHKTYTNQAIKIPKNTENTQNQQQIPIKIHPKTFMSKPIVKDPNTVP